MSKVLLVYEDFSEMVQLESTFKKIGFDVLGISNEASLSQQVIGFNPEVVVALGKGPKVSSIQVGRKLKEMSRWTGKVLLILPQGHKLQPEDLLKIRMDNILEAPVKTEKIVAIVARLAKMDEEAALAKLQNVHQYEAQQNEKRQAKAEERDRANESFFVSGNFEDKKEFKLANEGSLTSEKKSEFKFKEAETASDGKSKPFEFRPVQIDSENRIRQNPAEPAADGESAPSTSSGHSGDESHPTPKLIADELVEPPRTFKIEPHHELKEELKKASADLSERVSGYQSFLGGLSLNPVSSLKRKATRKVQQDLIADKSEAVLQDQDEARRDFTRALFKKTFEFLKNAELIHPLGGHDGFRI